MKLIKRATNKSIARETGTALLEVLVALAVLGAIGVAFLSGMATTSKASITTDTQSTAGSLARSQMEWVKRLPYSTNATYTAAPVPQSDDYYGYHAAISAQALNSPDEGIQKITVTIRRYDKEVLKLEGYKVDR